MKNLNKKFFLSNFHLILKAQKIKIQSTTLSHNLSACRKKKNSYHTTAKKTTLVNIQFVA